MYKRQVFSGTTNVRETFECGDEHEPCCNDGNGGTTCDAGFECNRTESCEPCGEAGQLACDGKCNGRLRPMDVRGRPICMAGRD